MKVTLRFSAIGLLLALVLLLSARQAPPVSAADASIVVNTTTDTDDNTDGACSLPEAILAANGDTDHNECVGTGSYGADTITFDIPETDSGCTAANVCTITLGSILPAIDDEMTIDGTGKSITISGNNSVRVMEVNTGKTLSVNGLRIVNGSAYLGGGIANHNGTVNVTNSTFSGNSTTASGYGGGIYNDYGTVTVSNSTFSGNSASFLGGGIFSRGTVSVTNSTFSGNSATDDGGGIYSYGTLNVTNSTFSGNGANQGGGTYNYSGYATVKNSIIANSTAGGNCGGNAFSASSTSNLADDNTCGSSFTRRTTAEIALGGLADNGGPTQTMALGITSSAINAGANTTCQNAPVSNLDQRGISRPQGLTCDVGAFELVYTATQSGPNYVVNRSADTNDGSCDTLGSGIGNQDCTLREAINAANSNSGADTITFNIPNTDSSCTAANVCTITLGSTLPAIGDEVTIDGAPNNGGITVSGNNAVRVMYVNSAKTLKLNALAIVNGKCPLCDGGGVYNNGGTLTVTDSSFSGNTSFSYGGGIHNHGGTLTVTNSTFSGNRAAGGGGVANAAGGAADVSNSTFSGNSASYAGAGMMSYGGSTLTVNSSIFSTNSADNIGGGIANFQGTLTVTNSSFSGNSAYTSGGGIENYQGTLTVTSSTLSGNNTTNIGGGGIHNNGGSLTVSNSTFSGNSADNSGGGILNDFASTLTVSNSTFSGNSAIDSGGGIMSYGGGTLNITNSTFSGNSGMSGGGIYSFSTTTLKNSIIANSPSGGNCGGNPFSASSVSNMADDNTCGASFTQKTSAEIAIGALGDNGGTTDTMALAITSVAIDAGDNTVCQADAGSPTYGAGKLDQRGEARMLNKCDIGAFERQVGYLTVIKQVENKNGGSAVASDWTFFPTSAAPSHPEHAAGQEAPGFTYILDPGSYSIGEGGGPSSYVATYSKDCSGTITVGESKTCTVTNAEFTATPTATSTSTATSTATETATSTATDTPTGTAANTATPTATETPTSTPTRTTTSTATTTATETPSATPTSSATGTLTRTLTATATPTSSVTTTATPTATRSSTPSATGTASTTPTLTRTRTATRMPSLSATATRTLTETHLPTNTATATRTRRPTRTPTSTAVPCLIRRPQLQAPKNHAAVHSTGVDLYWHESACATFYKLRVVRIHDPNVVIAKENHVTECEYYAELLPWRDSVFRWKVKACNALGCSKWSKQWEFHQVLK